VALIAYADGVHVAGVGPEHAARLAGLEPGAGGLDGAQVLMGWTPAAPAWLGSDAVRGTTYFGGYALADAVRRGRLRPLPVRLSAVPSLLARLAPAVAVVPGCRRRGELVFRGTVGIGPAAAAAAGAVVVEVDDDAPEPTGPPIPGRIVATVVRDPAAVGEARSRPPEPVDLAIGRHVAAVLPDEPTLQFGPGAVVEGIVRSLERPVRIWSGLFSDAMAELDGRGLLVGCATAGYTWGGEPVHALARAGRLELQPVEVTHDVVAASRLARFVSCNSAVQVGLDGSVNVERVGGRIIAGIGGHADFSAAASHCVDGISVVALRSTDRRGNSTIVERVEVVSTPRCDVDVVVTEHGVADLRGLDDGARANRIAGVAAPEHRDRLGVGTPTP
jgi:acyl-CoA hydrolase